MDRRKKMNQEKHRQRHIELHKALDELLGDFINHTNTGVLNLKIEELMRWSYNQTKNPTERVE
jgi:hypothetical protein